MCYDIETMLRREIKNALAADAPSEEIDYIRRKLEKYLEGTSEGDFEKLEHYWTNGWDHKKIPVITNESPDELQFFHWGLIPHWSYNKHDARVRANQCLNARSVTMFDKPSFRDPASERRCVILITGYYEYHWVDSSGNEKVPYFIKRKDGKPMFMAGLWDEWEIPDTDGQVVRTCVIVTTNANDRLSKIHNRNPNDPRMLVVLDFENVERWLSGDMEQEELLELCVPYPEELLTDYPVPKLKGKNGVGNTEKASQPFEHNIIGLP